MKISCRIDVAFDLLDLSNLIWFQFVFCNKLSKFDLKTFSNLIFSLNVIEPALDVLVIGVFS
ncbi:MAG: hypothetical protein CL677_01120 [Bdellovibrionaceae bacterium]|nr:hypothetical protein [Pseudobdellovibrionaceae bacterium]